MYRHRYIDIDRYISIFIYISVYIYSIYKYVTVLKRKPKTEAQASFLNLVAVAHCANGSLLFVLLFTKT